MCNKPVLAVNVQTEVTYIKPNKGSLLNVNLVWYQQLCSACENLGLLRVSWNGLQLKFNLWIGLVPLNQPRIWGNSLGTYVCSYYDIRRFRQVQFHQLCPTVVYHLTKYFYFAKINKRFLPSYCLHYLVVYKKMFNQGLRKNIQILFSSLWHCIRWNILVCIIYHSYVYGLARETRA
jgi:hypothetical protein